MKIEDLFTKAVKPEVRKRKNPVCSPISQIPLVKEKISTPIKFEQDVLEFLYRNITPLGITNIYSLENMYLDAALELEGNRLILLEFKFALNWRTACNARIEIQRFMQEKFFEKAPLNKMPEKALIIFDHFSGNWNRTSIGHKLENGWNFFYEEENVLRKGVSTIPIDIAQLTDKGIENLILRFQ